MTLTKKQIKYIKSDIGCIQGTLATLLDLNLQDDDVNKIERRTKKVISVLIYLNSNYKLMKRD